MFGKKWFTAAAIVMIAMVIGSVAGAVGHKPEYVVPMPVTPMDIRLFFDILIFILVGI